MSAQQRSTVTNWFKDSCGFWERDLQTKPYYRITGDLYLELSSSWVHCESGVAVAEAGGQFENPEEG
jgi:hypothetical protein